MTWSCCIYLRYIRRNYACKVYEPLHKEEQDKPHDWCARYFCIPMSARVVHKMGLEEDNQNILLMHSIGVNVSGQIASVIVGGLNLAFDN